MNEAPDFAAITLPAKRLAAAWTSVFVAAGQDPANFLLYRTVAVEVFPDEGVRLVATNGGLLLRVFVPELALVDEDGDMAYAEPAADEAPAATVVVRDLSKRVLGLMKYLTTAKPVDKEDDDASAMWAVTIAPGKIQPDGQPSLGDLFDEWGVVFTAPRSQECGPSLGEIDHVPHGSWRHIEQWAVPGKLDTVRFSPANLAAVASVASADGVTWQMGNTPTAVTLIGWDHPVAGRVHGLLMPMRPEHDETPTPDDDAQADADEVIARVRATRHRADPEAVSFTREHGEALAAAAAEVFGDDSTVSVTFSDAADLLPRGDYNPDGVDNDEPFEAAAGVPYEDDGPDFLAEWANERGDDE